MQGNEVFHDFILVTGNIGDPESDLGEKKLYIKCEKIYVAGEKAKGNDVETCKERKECFAGKEKVKRQLCEVCTRGQIVIAITEVQPKNYREDPSGKIIKWTKHLGPVVFNDCGKITLKELVAVLKDHTTRYSILKDNCWRYASHTFENVIKKFINHQDTTEGARERLTKLLEESKLKFPALPISCIKIGAVIASGFAVAMFASTMVVNFHVICPGDSITGKLLMIATDSIFRQAMSVALLGPPVLRAPPIWGIATGALSQQAIPRGGFHAPLVVQMTRTAKFACCLFMKLTQSWVGGVFHMKDIVVGQLVRILSSEVLLFAGTSAAILALLVLLGFVSYKLYRMYCDNRAVQQEG